MLYMSQVIGRAVLDRNGERLGKVSDLIVAVEDHYPPVTGLVVQTDGREIFLPWSSVRSLDERGAYLATARIDIGKFQQRPNEILLRSDLMDKQIVDIDGRKVVRVNDLRLDDIDGRVRLVAVDVGAAGLVRRLGFERGFKVIARNLHLSIPERYIDWEDVDPLETSIASVKLRVPHQGLAELHPADLAAILDRLTPRDRAGILASLDDEAVADAMEEMEPETQVEVIEDLARERAADILEEMSPDDAADLVADLDQDVRDEIFFHMERTEAEEVQDLLAFPEDSAGGIMTTAFIAVGTHVTAGGAIELLREWEPDAETIYYLYVTEDDDRLVGVLSLRDLIVAPPTRLVADIMIREPVAVGAYADEDEVAEVVAHYNLLAVPVVDVDGRLVGIVTIDDAIDRVIPSAWKKRLPRIFGRR
jgi:magnesium transporter